MATPEQERVYYEASAEERKRLPGIDYVGVTSTGVFCRAGCPARQPKFENCRFFASAEQALLDGLRPCKRCKPLSHPSLVPSSVRVIVDAVENNPAKTWHEADLRRLTTDYTEVKRQFEEQFGLTLSAYAQARHNASKR